MNILVTGATGAVGSALTRELADRPELHVWALVRDPARGAMITAPGTELKVGDLGRPDSLSAALDGVEAVFLACGNVDGQVDHEGALIDAAVAAGVRRIVKLSARGAAPDSPVAFWRTHAQIEDHLRSAGLESVVLRPSYLMTNLLAMADPIGGAGVLAAPLGEARIAMIDPRDVAAAAAAALTDGRIDQIQVLTGPTALGYAEVADALTTVIGRSVSYLDLPPEAFVPAMVAAGVPEFVAELYAQVLAALRAGAQEETTDAVRQLTGRPPRPLADFLADHAVAFRSAQPVSA